MGNHSNLKNKVNLLKHTYIWDSVYGKGFYLVVGDYDKYLKFENKISQEKWKEDVSPTDKNYSGSHGLHQVLIKDDESDREYLIWFPKIGWGVKDYDTYSHEALHHAIEALADSGVIMSNDNQEILTYYHGWVFRSILGQLMEWDKKKILKKKKTIKKRRK